MVSFAKAPSSFFPHNAQPQQAQPGRAVPQKRNPLRKEREKNVFVRYELENVVQYDTPLFHWLRFGFFHIAHMIARTSRRQ